MTETEIQASIMAAARAMGYKAYRLNAGGRRGRIRLLEPGTPDVLVLMRGGRTLFVEIKRAGEDPTDVQKERHRELRELGHAVTVARAVEDFIEAEKEVRNGIR